MRTALPHRLVVHLTTLAALLLAAGCDGRQAQAPPTAPPPVAAAPRTPEVYAESAFDGDRVLKKEEADVFGAPIPAAVEIEAAGDGAATARATHSYGEVKRFFEKHAKDDYDIDDRPGGLKLTPKSGDDLPVIYVKKPRRLGDRARISYHGKPGAKLPESLKAKVASRPEASVKKQGLEGAGSPPPAASDSAPRNNRERVVERDGKKVVVWEPKDSAPRTGRGGADDGRGGDRGRERKSLGGAKIKRDGVKR